MPEQSTNITSRPEQGADSGSGDPHASNLSASVWHSRIQVKSQNLHASREDADIFISASGQLLIKGQHIPNDPVILLEQRPGQLHPTQLERVVASKVIAEIADDLRKSHGANNSGTITLDYQSGSAKESQIDSNKLERSLDAALKSAMSAARGQDTSASYATVQNWPDGQQRVGPYSLTSHDIGGFLLDLGSPPDRQSTERLVREGKIPADFGAQAIDQTFWHDFCHFLKDLHHGRATTEEVKKYLPRELQDKIAQALIENIQSNGEHARLIEEALTRASVPVKPQNMMIVDTIIDWESAWHPSAVNNWDSNARAGHPSAGLMQCIPETFKKYTLPGLSRDITDPLANVVAGVRYAIARYGSLSRVPGIVSLNARKDYRGY